MKISKTLTVALLSLALSAVASAKEFRMQIQHDSENSDGNFVSEKVSKGLEDDLQYVLVPASVEAANDLAGKSCPGSHFRVEGSVLSRHTVIDEESRRYALETVKLLTRKITCVGISDR
jgi:hypothetical protein